RVQPWHLHAGRRLSVKPPSSESTKDCFRYDPADPTPSIGGPLLLANVSGPRDNRPVEARPDVLVYTSDVLPAPYEVVGPVTATVFVSASRPYHDVFVRLCDVHPSGRSVNVCDGLTRVVPGRYPSAADGTVAVPVE